MTTTARRLVQIFAVTGGALFLVPSAAMATVTPYVPPTPAPTVSGVVVGTPGPTTPGATTPAPTVSGVRTDTVSPAPVVGGSALPRTGADVLAWTVTGGALVVGGIGLVGMARRRSEAKH